MSKPIQAIRGMKDVLPDRVGLWQHVEAVARDVLSAYGYLEIRLPIIEYTALFARSIGELTDIVEKEMYTFEDRNGDSLTLRPEATAGCVRAGIEHGLLHNRRQRLWYSGPMFRHERPQRGRYRQFHQIGVEAFGMGGPDIDAEQVLMSARLWRELNVQDLTLEINSLGTPESRARYRGELVAYLERRRDRLDQDSLRRLSDNPLRILDSKNPSMQTLLAEAPRLSSFLDDASRRHFDLLREYLDAAGIAYKINTRLVRGLDYYTRTVFEWTTGALGAQGTVCAGGRYDGLVELLGGRPTPAVGFALGMERLIELLAAQGEKDRQTAPQLYLVLVGERAESAGTALAEALRDEGWRIQVNCGGGGFKSQMKRADRSGAVLALLLGEDEVEAGCVTVKWLREDTPQQRVGRGELGRFLSSAVGGD